MRGILISTDVFSAVRCREESTIDGRIIIRCLHRSVLLKLSSSRGPLGAAETRKYVPVHAGANDGWLERGIIALTKSMLTVFRHCCPLSRTVRPPFQRADARVPST